MKKDALRPEFQRIYLAAGAMQSEQEYLLYRAKRIHNASSIEEELPVLTEIIAPNAHKPTAQAESPDWLEEIAERVYARLENELPALIESALNKALQKKNRK